VSKTAPVSLGSTEDHLLALPEVAKRLACSPATVRRLGTRGVLRQVRLGRSVRYRSSDVTRLVTEGVPRADGRAA